MQIFLKNYTRNYCSTQFAKLKNNVCLTLFCLYATIVVERVNSNIYQGGI